MLAGLSKIAVGVFTAVGSIISPVKTDKVSPVPQKPRVVEERKVSTTTPFQVSVSSTSPVALPPTKNIVPAKKSMALKATSTPLSKSPAVKKPPAPVATSTAFSNVPKVKAPPPNTDVKKNEVPAKLATATTTPTPSSPPTGVFPLNPAWRDAMVNLICTDRYSETVDSISSGSGVIIDERGVILTNAHVAANFLFADWPTPSLLNCSVRTGSPAYPFYKAVLLYLPDAWAEEYFKVLYKADDSGYVYGKKDYALLLITSRTDPDKQLPKSFPHLSLSTDIVPAKGSFAYIMAYPAGFFGGVIMQRDLHLASSPAIIDHLNSIGSSTTPDILAFKGTIAGQHGSSGGAVIDKEGRIVGIPTFFDKGAGVSTSDNVLNAITTLYVSRDLKNESGFSLKEFLSRSDLLSVSKEFMKGRGAKYQRSYVDDLRKNQDITIPGVTY